MKKTTLGKSVNGIEIVGYFFGSENAFNKTLVLGAIHGVEPQSKEFCDLFLEEIKDRVFSNDNFLVLIPCINPDGLKKKTRVNANDVDLNRNFPSASWKKMPTNIDLKSPDKKSPYYPGVEPASEPETKIIVELLKKYNFKVVVSIHTNHFVQNPNPPMINYDGEQSRELAEKIAFIAKLPCHSDIGYITSGTLGGYVGNDLKKISITVELDDLKSGNDLYKNHGKMFSLLV